MDNVEFHHTLLFEGPVPSIRETPERVEIREICKVARFCGRSVEVGGCTDFEKLAHLVRVGEV